MTKLKQGDVITLRKTLHPRPIHHPSKKPGPLLVAGQQYLVIEAKAGVAYVWGTGASYEDTSVQDLVLHKLERGGRYNPQGPRVSVTHGLYSDTYETYLDDYGLKVVGHMAPQTAYQPIKPVSKGPRR